MARTAKRPMVGDAEIILLRKEGDFADWIRCRRNGLGGTDAAALIGANPYKSVTSLFFEKMATQDEPVQMDPVQRGRVLGPAA
jgi:predicted phage-related endonuclease